MAQNIYDKPELFAGYSQLPRSVLGLNGAPEWPAIRAITVMSTRTDPGSLRRCISPSLGGVHR